MKSSHQSRRAPLSSFKLLVRKSSGQLTGASWRYDASANVSAHHVTVTVHPPWPGLAQAGLVPARARPLPAAGHLGPHRDWHGPVRGPKARLLLKVFGAAFPVFATLRWTLGCTFNNGILNGCPQPCQCASGPRPARGRDGVGPGGATFEAAKILSHLGRWDRSFSHPTFFEVGGIENFPIPLPSRQVG